MINISPNTVFIILFAEVGYNNNCNDTNNNIQNHNHNNINNRNNKYNNKKGINHHNGKKEK